MQSFSSSAFFPRAWGKNALFGRFSGIKWRSGVRQAAWHLVTRQGFARDAESVMNEVEKKFSYPVFVKPAGTGSSVGVSKAKNRGELSAALAQALKAR